ncbi:MoaD/ThiS family protein [Sphingomonas prati]|uniref:Molybdopterin synthase sulfur carrier subunit n=1 Tax=Sphingomonas prati TaxID=1843237 RepID=A0A7W9BU17_9SPHN|nr:MoaD/ThiS family protein [Sphingomonas prati]MBB5730108.1 molybdopterin synthase sulfur carrier subunit [Sphingomonas prati]GGE91551.1 molybdopterin synthase sulfur carrier subunit [Sphingomonas prati]
MAIEMLYFAWVRERVGMGAERVDPPADIATVADLIGWLAGQSGGHAAAFEDAGRIRAAIDDRFVGLDAAIGGAREIALFPPVTGG